jgi:hypothetical protein
MDNTVRRRAFIIAKIMPFLDALLVFVVSFSVAGINRSSDKFGATFLFQSPIKTVFLYEGG